MFITSRAAQYMHRICTVQLMHLIRNNCNEYRNIYIYIYTQDVSGGIVNISEGGSIDYSE